MEKDKIKEAFNAISNDINSGFSSAVALTELVKNEDLDIIIKKLEKCLTNKK